MLPDRPRNRSSSHGDREPKFAPPRSQPRMSAAQLSKARIDVDSRDQMPSRSRERSRDAQDRVGWPPLCKEFFRLRPCYSQGSSWHCPSARVRPANNQLFEVGAKRAPTELVLLGILGGNGHHRRGRRGWCSSRIARITLLNICLFRVLDGGVGAAGATRPRPQTGNSYAVCRGRPCPFRSVGSGGFALCSASSGMRLQ
jgi:hypothetical protein